MPVDSALYRVGQDLELRLGVLSGEVAAPDYRDSLADLIAERFRSRYAFCKATGVDQGNLSHVLAGRRHFSTETLLRVLETLGVRLELAARESASEATDPFEADEPTERLRRLHRKVAALEQLAARAESCAAKDRLELLPHAGPSADGLDAVRARVGAGEDLPLVIDDELGRALSEEAKLARAVAREADAKRRARSRAAG